MNESDLQAEMIEVVPELPFHDDSEDDFSEYSDENEADHQQNPFHLNNMDEDDEPFDEYGNNFIKPNRFIFSNFVIMCVCRNVY